MKFGGGKTYLVHRNERTQVVVLADVRALQTGDVAKADVGGEGVLVNRVSPSAVDRKNRTELV